MKSDPFFVLGHNRSGTTLLRLMLSSHPEVGIPPEGGFIALLYPKYGATRFDSDTRRRFARDMFRVGKYIDWEFEVEELAEELGDADANTFAEVIDAVYSLYLRRKLAGKTRWGDKTNYYAYHVDRLATAFPDAKFLWIVRDGRDVALSCRKIEHELHDIRQLALRWQMYVHVMERSIRKLGERQVHIMRYEDLVARPEDSLREACQFLSLSFDTQMLEFDRTNREQSLVPERHLAWLANTRNPLNTGSVGRWKSEMSDSDERIFRTIAGQGLMRYGYQNHERVWHRFGEGAATVYFLAKKARIVVGDLRRSVSILRN